MRFLKVLASLLVILLVSSLLAPWIYSFTDFKFERIMSRLVMVFTIAGLLLFVRIRRSDLPGYGLTFDANWRKCLVQGFVIGFLVLMALTAVLVVLDARVLTTNWRHWSRIPIKGFEYIFSAMIIGLIEETFFRGILFARMRSAMPIAFAMILLNAFYAAVHFFKGGHYQVPDAPNFADSLKVLLHLGDAYLEPLKVLPSFMGLFIFGLILTYAFMRTSSLWLSIGLHAGCVYFLKMDGLFIGSVPGASLFLYGDKELHNGLVGWGFLALMFVVIRLVSAKKAT